MKTKIGITLGMPRPQMTAGPVNELAQCFLCCIPGLTISAMFKTRSNLQLVCLACHHILTVHVAAFPFQYFVFPHYH